MNVGGGEDILVWRVVDLKKKLKSYGLPITGNKSELIERLQEAMMSKKGFESSPDVNTELLHDDSAVMTNTASVLEDALLGDSPLSSPNKEKISMDLSHFSIDQSANSHSTPVIIPFKKRVAARTSETVEKKKIVLNRNNIPTPKISPKSVVPSKTVSESSGDENQLCKDEPNKDKGNNGLTTDLPGSVIRLSGITKQDLSPNEKISMRAKRFNISDVMSKSVTLSDQAKKQLISNISSNNSTLPPSTNIASIDVLKKRAQRFGENVSSVMKKLEEQHKVLKRKSKFGVVLDSGSSVSIVEEQHFPDCCRCN